MSRSVVIDLRDAAEYDRGHVAEAYSFPWSSIKSLTCGLPSRYCSLVLVVDSSIDVGEVKSFFQRLNYHRIELLHELVCESFTTQRPTQFCWSPNPFLSETISYVESIGGKGIALDVGSGTGRDMVYLASRGWSAIGIENRRKLIQDGSLLASNCHLGHRVAFLEADLKQRLPLRKFSFDLINICRFIYRPAMPQLFFLLKPRGVFVYSHFLQGCEKTKIGRPKNMRGFFLLGELEELFVNAGFDILRRDISTLSDGRPVVNVVARAPASQPCG